MATTSVRIESLTKDNYDTWKIHMESLLVKNEMWEYVSGEIKKPELIDGNAESTAAVKKWEKEDRKAKSDILLGISPGELKQVKDCVTSRDVWTSLQRTYQSKGPARKATLLKRLTLHRMEEGADVREHMKEFFDTLDKLIDMGVSLDQDQLSIMLIYSLPASFENFRCAIESRDNLPIPADLRIKIVEESDARRKDVRGVESNAMFARKLHRPYGAGDGKSNSEQTNDNKKKLKCFRCHKLGHKVSECRQRPKNADRGTSANVGFFTSLTMQDESAEIKARSENWCIDSGCTAHMCNDSGKFTNSVETFSGKLNLASSATTEVTARGTVLMNAVVKGNADTVTLSDTLHVPDLRKNLLSVSKITDKGFSVVFEKQAATVVDRDGNSVLRASRVDGLYLVDESSPQCSAFVSGKRNQRSFSTSAELWHRRMGHLNLKDLEKCVRDGRVLGMDIGKLGKIKCDVCFRGKMTRSSFPKASERSSSPLELVHSDVCGPFRLKSNGGARYFVTFVDDFSRWCEVRMLKSKDEVLDSFKSFKAYAENLTGKTIKYLQTDNGREYVNAAFDNLLREAGIKRRLSVTYTPEQNGLAERKNRTILDMTRCLLIQSSLPESFWGEAVNTANYIRNRCPSVSLGGITPFEKWTGRAPNVSHFHTFGCEVYSRNRQPNQGKLQPRSRKGVFVGYSETSKAYRVWIPEERRVDVTRDVAFMNERPVASTKDYADLREESEATEEPGRSSESSESAPPVEVLMPRRGSSSEEMNENSDGESHDGSEVDNEETPRRGRGRPRIERTGLRGRPRKLFHMANNATSEVEESFLMEVPLKEALNGPDADEWLRAMASEFTSMLKNDTWRLVQRPEGRKVIGSRTVLRNKYLPDGTLEKRKARIVARGFSQRPGVDFSETFAPVARVGSVRLIASLATQFDLDIHQFDVETAYLNGELEEEVFMETPDFAEDVLEYIIETNRGDKGIIEKSKKMLSDLRSGDMVCSLKKSIYGLKQAGRRWHIKLCDKLKAFGLCQSSADPCIFFSGREKDVFIVAVYVDDILVVSRDQKKVSAFETYLSKCFELKKLGKIKYFLGMEFSRDQDGITICQKGYVNDLLRRFDMDGCNPVKTPIDPGTKLKKNEEESTFGASKRPYRELVGSLMYLAVCSRPDIAFAASYLSQYNSGHDESHWNAGKRVLRYLKGTSGIGIRYSKKLEPLIGFVDADWANNAEDRRSYSGFAFLLGGSPISWVSRKQRTVALSTTEAEYMALAEATKEAVYLRRFLIELGFDELAPVSIFDDNCGAIKLAENPVFHNRSKHIDVRHHYVRETLKEGWLKLQHLASQNMAADVLTKGIVGTKHSNCLKGLGLNIPASGNIPDACRGEVLDPDPV